MRYRSSAIHSRRLSRVGIELIGMDDSHAVHAPTGFGDDFLLGRVGVEREFYYHRKDPALEGP
jgi:hypothetical protein